MTVKIYLITFLVALALGGLNSWYWKTQGYNQGGRLFFLGTIAFFGVIVLILNAIM